MSGRFQYVAYDIEAQAAQKDCKAAFENVEDILERNFSKMSVELEHAMQKLEEAYMWVGKELKRQQIARDIASMEQLG